MRYEGYTQEEVDFITAEMLTNLLAYCKEKYPYNYKLLLQEIPKYFPDLHKDIDYSATVWKPIDVRASIKASKASNKNTLLKDVADISPPSQFEQSLARSVLHDLPLTEEQINQLMDPKASAIIAQYVAAQSALITAEKALEGIGLDPVRDKDVIKNPAFKLALITLHK